MAKARATVWVTVSDTMVCWAARAHEPPGSSGSPRRSYPQGGPATSNTFGL
jgi:hypothetical protein